MLGAQPIGAGFQLAVGIQNPQIVLGPGHAGKSGLSVPVTGGGEIWGSAGGFDQHPQQELRVGMIVPGGGRQNADGQRRVCVSPPGRGQ